MNPESAEDAAGKDQQPEGSPLHTEAESSAAVPNGEVDKKDEQSPSNGAADGSLNVPFAQRPEWKGLMALAGDKRSEAAKLIRPVFEQNQHLSERVRVLQPMAEVVGELRTLTGDDQGFNTMRTIVRTYAQEPDKAIPVLEEMLKDARQRAGLEITSPDLTQRLADIDEKQRSGVLDASEAEAWKEDLRRAEQARASGRQAQDRLQQATTEQARATEQSAAQATMKALNDWEANIRKHDADFGEVTEPSDPEHGRSVADQVYDALVLKRVNQPEATAKDLLAEAQRVYKLAVGRLNSGQLRQQRVLTSEGSSITARAEAKTLRERLDQIPPERAA